LEYPSKSQDQLEYGVMYLGRSQQIDNIMKYNCIIK